MTDSPVTMEDGSDQELSPSQQQQHHQESGDGLHVGSNRLPNGIVPVLSDSNEVAVLRDENSRLLTTLLEYKKMLDTTKLRYGTVKREFYAAKKRLKRLADKLQVATANAGSGGSSHLLDGSDSGGSTPMHQQHQQQQQQQNAGATADEEIRKKWKEPNLKAAIKLKAAIGVQAYQSLIRDGELQLPSLRTISRYVDALKKAGLKPNYDFNVRDSDTVGNSMFDEEEDGDSGDVDHNRNQQPSQQQQHHQGKTLLQQQLQRPQLSRDVSDAEDPVNCTAMPDISYFRGKMEHDDLDDDDFDEDQPSDLYLNGGALPNGDAYARHPNQHTYQQQTLTAAHIEFLKSMTGFRKKWTPFELRTCMDIRRIIGSKEYDSLRKNDGMPLPSAKTLRKYKHTVHLDGVDVMSRKRNYREMIEGLVTNGHDPAAAMNGGMPGGYGDDVDDIMNAEEPDGYFDINNLSEEQIDFLQSLSSNTKGFSDYELQKTLELKNELGGNNYEILRKQECLHIPTLAMLKKYEHDNGLEDLSAMVAAEDVDEDDDQEPEQEPEPDYDNELQAMDHYGGGGGGGHGGGDLNGTGDDSHMGVFEHHSIFDKDATAFDMSKLSQLHVEFLNTLPENPKRWTQHMINSALNIKNEIGTRDYELLRRQGIPLPAARTLRRHKDLKSRVKEDYSDMV